MGGDAAVAVVGLGAMGRAMAERLAADGHTVRAWNRTPRSAPEGVALSEDLPSAVRGAGVVISMLADDPVVEQVTLGPGGVVDALDAGAVHAGMSTVSPPLTARLAERHASAGRAYVAAPVFGRPDAAAAGVLHIVPGGAPADVERLGAVFGSLGQRVHPQATPAQASLMKLVGNFMIAAVVEAIGEAMALAETGGVPRERTLELLSGTLFDAPVLRSYGPQVAARRFTPAGFAMPLGLKDVELARSAAHEGGLDLPLADLVRDHMEHALARGRHDHDWSAMATVAEERSEGT